VPVRGEHTLHRWRSDSRRTNSDTFLHFIGKQFVNSTTRHFPEAKKRFGQHFLHDPHIIDRIVRAINPRPGQRILEIGPGTGALTVPLLQALGELDVLELDRDLVENLRNRCASAGTLRIHLGDALRCSLREFVGSGQPVRIVGNLPYNISTTLMFHFLSQVQYIEDMVFMLQREVAERLYASADSEHYGRLSVMVQYHCEVEKLLSVAPGAFHPPPQVHSTVVRLIPRLTPEPLNDRKRFETIVRAAFGQRRKTLRNSLKAYVDAAGFEAAGINPGHRAETLNVADFVRLTNSVCRQDGDVV
jgi:16S rRNA (adenine1518-N6/adenine1519-N6)-dimethyltransferase